MKNIIIDNIEYKLVPVEKEEGKDYEIITFGCEGGFDRTLNKYGGYSLITGRDTYPMGKKYSTLIESPNYYIKSVKRLSDGVTFTIGDMCNPVATDYKYNKRPITKIWFTDFNSLRISSENYTLPISGIEHSKMPLFRTDFEIIDWEGDKENFHIGDTILSVKRKSDNVTFKIGDRIKEGVIINIIINKGKIYLEI